MCAQAQASVVWMLLPLDMGSPEFTMNVKNPNVTHNLEGFVARDAPDTKR